MERQVAVIGGGYAGLAAAVTLARHGMAVTVFEAARRLGGRARGVDHRGLVLDNGQHLLLGAYRQTLGLIDLVAPEDAACRGSPYLRLPLGLEVPGQFRLKIWPLPGPLGLALGLLAAGGLSLGDRVRALGFMAQMRRRKFSLAADMSVAALLAAQRQGERARRLLWQPLCLAALNTPPEAASAQVFLNVLRDTLNGQHDASNMILPRIDLGRLFPERAARYLERRGGCVRTSAAVRAVLSHPAGFEIAADAGSERFSQVVCAVAPQHLARVVTHLPELSGAVEMVRGFEYEPIYTVYLQYPEHVGLASPILGLTGGIGQWVFDRGRVNQTPGLLAVVISARGAHQALSREALAQRVHEELAAAVGGLPPPRWQMVIAEKRSTFSCRAGIRRPGQLTPLRGFYLAGDYTAGDYPATLEAAVQSGVKCAHHLLNQDRGDQP